MSSQAAIALGFPLLEKSHWSIVYASVAALVVTMATLVTSVVVGSLDESLLLIMSGVLWGLLFLISFSLLMGHLPRLPVSDQLRVLFAAGLIARLGAVALTYAGFRSWNGTPFEPYASDTLYYHDAAITLSRQFVSADLPGILAYTTPSNLGYIVFVGVVYSIFGVDVLAVRVIQAVIGAYTAILLYRMLRIAVSEGVARTGAALLALSPYLVYYTGLHLKETVLNALIVSILYLTIRISERSSTRAIDIVALVAALGSMFFFRTFLAVLLITSVCGHILIQRRGRVAHKTRAGVLGAVVVAMVVIVGFAQPRLWSEVIGLAATTAGQWERELLDKEQNLGTSIETDLASQGMFVAAAAVGPLPALVNIRGQENNLIQYGFAWARQVFLLFAAIGLYIAVRRGFRRLGVVLFLLLGYIVIIGAAGLPTSHRFQLPTLPAWCAMAAIGLHVPWRRARVFSAWTLSLLVLAAVVMTWNYLKLSVRGI